LGRSNGLLGDARSTPSTAIERTDDDARRAQAFRKLALKKHPDKRPASEREAAEREFDALQKAHDALVDVDARRALDDVLRAKAAREEAHAKRDAKRRRAVEDLEARERAASEGGRRGAEAEARERLRVELERLRRRREEATRARGVSGGDASGIGVDARAEVPAHLYRAIKVVWRRASDADEDAYTAKELRETFEKIGRVEDVVIREGKKKKGSALVVFGDEETCVQASRVTCGRPDNALIISRAAVPPEGHASANVATDARPSVASDEEANAPKVNAEDASAAPKATPHAANADFESVVLERLKRAQERARLLAEAEKDDEE
jgi:DnaJ family protein C protein 17